MLTTHNDPIAVLVEIANDPDVDVQVRVSAAIGAAPFMFPRLSAAVVATAPLGSKDTTAAIIERLTRKFARLVQPSPLIEAEPLQPAEVE